MPDETHGGLDRSIAYLNLAFACVKTQHYGEAVEQAEQVLARVTDSPKFISDARLWIASAHLARGELAQAREQIRLAREQVENATPPIYNDNVEQLTADLLTAEGRHTEAATVLEYMYSMAIQRQELDYAISALNNLKANYERSGDTRGLVSVYKRLAEGIPARQKQGSDLRFNVLRMVFAMDKAALEAELNLSQQKTAIMRRLSHEFRTPLAIIQTSVDLVSHYGDRLTLEQRQKRLTRITDQVQWMTVMLDDILEVLQLDDDEAIAPILTEFRLDDLAQAALLQLEQYGVSQRRVQVEIQPQESSIHGARKALQIILIQLLTNAVKFSQEMARLDLIADDRQLTIRVSDRGIGIPAEEQQAIFQPLVRGINLEEVAGNGLGLAIVAKLVQQLRGHIDLASAVGVGTTITVTVPINDAA
jgi:signal transduction histidine kinase